jgi:hemoglobin/transferrin/lactoferrin receptor protein
MKKYILALGLLGAVAANAQSTTDTVQVKEVITSATKFATPKEHIAQQIQVIDQKELQANNAMNTADVMANTGNIVVQKSQGGGGSPIIRGFEANKVLIMVDGVRLNNAIFRGGHLQNVLRVDNAALDRVEVMYGPSSTQYGSDALGGVMSFYTKKAVLNNKSANAMVRMATATGEQAVHLDVNTGFKKLAFLTSVSYGNYGDVRMGADYRSVFPGFGQREYYVVRNGNQDSMVKNANPLVQVGSAYNQYDVMEKIMFAQNDHLTHTLNVQYSNTGNVNRYDRLTEYSGSNLKYAQWYYGPEERLLASYRMDYTRSNKLFDKMSIILAHQAISESRNSRKFNKTLLKHQNEAVGVNSFDIDAMKTIRQHELHYGFEGYFNTVNSTATFEDVNTGLTSVADTRYPSGGSTMNNIAAYVQDQITIEENKWYANVGARLTSNTLTANFADTTFFKFPFKEVTQKHTALSGTASLVYMPSKVSRIALLGSTGFRSPNVDDMTKVFETGPGYLIAPNPTLQPEYTYNAELSASRMLGTDGMIEGGVYYTFIDHALVVDRGTLNGNDSALYEGAMTAVYTTQNKGQAMISGIYAAAKFNVGKYVVLSGNFNKSHGRVLSSGMETPLDHIAPMSAKIAVDYRKNKLNAGVWMLMNGRKPMSEYLLNAEDNEMYATPMGTLAWQCVNARLGYNFNSKISMQLACENILDMNYRVFASGISAPGRNFKLTLRASL